MKFQIDSKELARITRMCAAVSGSGSAKSIVNFLRLRAIAPDTLSAESNNGIFSVIAYAGADILEAGECIVDATKLSRLIAARAGTVNAHTTKLRLMVNNAGSKLRFNFYDGKQLFPDSINLPMFPQAKITGRDFRNLSAISFLAAKNDSHMQSLALRIKNGKLESMATDGFKVGYCWHDIDWDGQHEFLVPPAAASTVTDFMSDVDEINLYLTPKKIIISADDFLFSSVGIEGNYPFDAIHRMVTADCEKGGRLDVADFADVLRACSIMSVGESDVRLHHISLDSTENENVMIVKTAEENQTGYSEFMIDLKKPWGGGMQFFLDGRYLGGILKALKEIMGKSNMATRVMGTKPEVNIGISNTTNFVNFWDEYTQARFSIAPVKK